jgi:Flp pilus assembly protein TadB
VSVDPIQPRGIRASVRRVVTHARSVSELQKELATVEMKEKSTTLGTGAGLGVGAGLFALYAIGFGLATGAVALALVLDLWLALLIVFVLLVVITAILALLARAQMKRVKTFAPEQAIEEARLTKQALRSGHGV